MNLHYNKSDLRKFQIGRYVEIMTFPDQDGKREVAGLGTIVGIGINCFNEVIFRVEELRNRTNAEYHASNLQLIE